MQSLNDLSAALSGAQSIKYKPAIRALFLEVPQLNNSQCSEINQVIKQSALNAPLYIQLHFKNEKELSLNITGNDESCIIAKLRPTYSVKRKLEFSNPETVELCLYNYKFAGLYMGAKFKLQISEDKDKHES